MGTYSGKYRTPTDYMGRPLEEYRENLPGEGERLTFGVHRLAYDERTAPAWPRTLDTWPGYTRWLKGAAEDPGITRRVVTCVKCLLAVELGEATRQSYSWGTKVDIPTEHDKCPSMAQRRKRLEAAAKAASPGWQAAA